MSTKTYKFWDFRNSVIRNLYVLLHNTFLLSIIFISFVYLNKTIRIISSIVSSDFTETFLFFLLEESAVPKSSIWWGTVTKLGQFTKKKRSRLVRSSLQIPLRNEKRKEVEGGRKSCDRSRNSAGSSPVWEEIFWKKKKETRYTLVHLSLSLSLSLSVYSFSSIVKIDRFENGRKEKRRNKEGRCTSLFLSLHLSFIFDRRDWSIRKFIEEKRKEGGRRNKEGRCSLSLSLSLSLFLSILSFRSAVRKSIPSKKREKKEE